MKWRNRYGKDMDEDKIRKHGEVRGLKLFAWLPVHIEGDTIWLQKYYRIESWSRTYCMWVYEGLSLVWD